jgi:Flp pilus assembly protein TadG
MMMEIAMPRINSRRDWEEGATAVEAAISLGVLAFLIFGIIDFGMALWQWNTMVLAVEQAGRYAMVNNATITPATAEAQMQAVLTSASISCPLPSSPAAGNWYICATTNAGTPPTMSLSVSYGYSIIGLAGPFRVAAQATVPLD